MINPILHYTYIYILAERKLEELVLFRNSLILEEGRAKGGKALHSIGVSTSWKIIGLIPQ